jgi:futalosine hydrolase
LNKPLSGKILIVSATKLEIEPLLRKATLIYELSDGLSTFRIDSKLFNLLITGVGIPATTFEMANYCALNFTPLAIHIGIAGSYKEKLINGEVVMLIEDEFGELGIEQNSNFGTLFESGLTMPNHFPFINGKLINVIPENIALPDKMKKVKGLTINLVTTDKKLIQKRAESYNADIETMESAAFFYCCLMHKIPFLSFRGISNQAGESNKTKWAISESIQNVCDIVLDILSKNNFSFNET